MMFLPGCAFSARTDSITSSRMIVVSRHVLHQREEAPAKVVVPVGQRPAAVPEPSISILVFAPRRLQLATNVGMDEK
jgi:hypothetical protein